MKILEKLFEEKSALLRRTDSYYSKLNLLLWLLVILQPLKIKSILIKAESAKH